MNIDTNIDYLSNHERDEQSFGYFKIGRKKINTETVSCDTIFRWSDSFCENYLPIDSCFLNSLLRSKPIYKIYLTVTEPIFICVQFTDNSATPKQFYKISFGNFIFFQENYCENYEIVAESKLNWLKEGF